MIEHYYWNDEIFDENWFGYQNLYQDAVKEFKDDDIFVEVGSWKGRSSSFLAVEISNSQKDISFYCVDTWEGGPDHQGWDGLDELYDCFLKNMKPVEGFYIPLRTTSEEASKKFEDSSLSFVFLDASHEYEDIKNDIEKWLPKVKPGGILAGHDYYPDGSYDWFPGVKKAVKEKFNNFESKENCWIYRVPSLQEKEIIKVLFFGRHTKDDVWEYDFILNELLPKDKIPIIKFLQLDEVQITNIEFDVFVYSSRDPNNYPWGYMPTYEEVLECVLKTKPKVIIQLSDEFYYEDLNEHNSLANYCKLFLRQYHHPNYEYTENTLQLPLAYCNDTPIKNKIIREIKDRDLNWSFVGNIKSDRFEMIEKFKSLDNHFISSSSSKEEMVDIYNRSIFVPNGRGNSSLNCYRLYEASICGAIPVVVGPLNEIQDTFKYEENPPWIFCNTWEESVEICKNLLNDKNKLQEIQSNILEWWNKRISRLKQKINQVFSEQEKDDCYKLKNFPPINFISVDKSEERRKLLYEKFKKYNLTNIRPHIFDVYDDEKHHYVGNGYNNLIGIGRGPTTSHLKAIKDWYFDTDEPYAFFCEDDISFESVKYWNFTWEEFFNNLPKDWECVQLCWVREFNMFIFSDNGLKLRHRCWCDWSACAYLIKRTHAKKLISNYYRNGSFNLDFAGNDAHVRLDWAKLPNSETIVFSPLGNPKDSTINTSVIYGFPLFLEDYYRCDSDLLVYDKQNSLYPIRYKNEYSYNEILNWWKNKGKNLKIEDIIDI